jgi:hypothetical protein
MNFFFVYFKRIDKYRNLIKNGNYIVNIMDFFLTDIILTE